MNSTTDLRQRIQSMNMSPSERAHALQNLAAAEAFAEGMFAIAAWLRRAVAPKAKPAPAGPVAAH